jgi:sugar lactone lactonase YvrE
VRKTPRFCGGRIIALLALALLESTSKAAQLIYTSYAFSTAAGMPGFSGYWDAPIGQAAVFHYPAGVAADSNGNVYVADTFNGAVRKLTPVGTNWTVTTISRAFSSPYGLTLDKAGSIYVADTGNSAIRKLTPAGTNWVLSTLPGFYASLGVAVDSGTNVYLNDGSSIIVKITPTGAITTLAGLSGVTGTNDGTGSSARFNHPCGLAVDSATNIYVADSGNNTIRKVTPQGVVTTLAGKAGFPGGVDGTNGTSSIPLFNSPQGVAVDGATNVYVADYNNHTIRRITPAGVVTTLGGLLNLPASVDATGIEARFNYPEGLTVNDGIIYVADSQNDTIRRGIITAPVIVRGGVGFNNRRFGFSLTGLPGQPVVVQGSTNLVNWFPLWTNTLGAEALSFSDPQAGPFTERFYRAFIPR